MGQALSQSRDDSHYDTVGQGLLESEAGTTTWGRILQGSKLEQILQDGAAIKK